MNRRFLLEGLRVVEFAERISGPMAGGLLADHGADVVHVECPGHGDPLRGEGPAKDGVHLWWKVAGRNKRSVTLDLEHRRGQELARDLAATADVVITNLSDAVLRTCGLHPDALHERHPRLVVLRISALGDGADASGASIGKVAEAMSGVAQLTGPAGGPPVLSGFAQAETLTALMGATAIQAAIYRRDTDPDFRGECIDLALFETLFRVIEWQVAVHDQLGTVFERAGNQMALGSEGVVDTFRTGDGDWIIITSGTQRGYENLARLLGQDALALPDPTLLKQLLTGWVNVRTTDACIDALLAGGVSASRIYSAADIAGDAAFTQRGSIVTVDDDELGPVCMPSPLPHLLNHPGEVWRTGPALGADNAEVFGELLGLSPEEVDALARDGVI